ncbi:maleylpyruvate isomerase family mycothiol-dependent enzyme [Aestuariimicrobium soli]|uniref:maleylpyruvate isomerase family mycothiol-dependent enzyme n=1 Tax=Aestuariimicrobium soli TaxID=2035834 RepID=UPI003EB9AFF3
MTDQHTRPSRDIDPFTVIDTEGARFAAVLAGCDLDAPVPTCPGWSGRDLLKHVIEVHDFWAAVVGDGLMGDAVGDYEDKRAPIDGDADELLRQREEATGRLVAALRKRQPDEEAWSWFEPDQTVDFSRRMQTQEITLHRVDAELTAGVELSPIADDVAAAGVDHVLDVMLEWVPDSAEITPTGVIELRATDTGESWLLELYRWNGTAWGSEFRDQIGGRRAPAGAEPVALVAGPVQQLDLTIWSRPSEVEQSGDEAALAELRALLEFGIQ